MYIIIATHLPSVEDKKSKKVISGLSFITLSIISVPKKSSTREIRHAIYASFPHNPNNSAGKADSFSDTVNTALISPA